ncbi:hypothetical protein FD04_GL001943 [Secundilactobacillus odoratitofui DSM 19909 = JCM 15043]|uniref:Integral membrane protein n=1 Tax=Secundilactobacillus odoratitofui DSM 19909 = JCM 15043 TaxID=1423776 RepID=A0A0R1LME1_9LACO|nr:DUF1634 domain-containing protein [Secundilactobacillus odoratitofui]KRK97083.1 hypothetical protein FD04_GL001943 [Secundilactobacillus odoratitofui DSM 19909 = JCM 15043]
MANKPESTEKEMAHIEIMIGRILQIGVVIAAIVMLIGLILLLVNGGDGGYAVGHQPTTISTILSGTAHMKPYAIMMVGMFCLILTPVLRVVVSIYAFYKEHDHLYVWITTAVLIILCVSFIIGHTV